MKTKYHRYTLQGELSAEDAQRALGDAASQGLIVRLDNIGGQTHVYIASQDTGSAKGASSGAKTKVSGGVKVKKVSESEVTKIG